MSDEKQGLDLIIDRVEALRVRLDSYRSDAHQILVGNLEHWIQLCVEAKTEAVKLARVPGGGGLTPDELKIALANVGVDITCGACAELFYTGHYNAKHTHPPRDQGIQQSLDAMTAILALPQGDTPENIAACVKICVRRCQELEQKLIDFQDSHRAPQQVPVVQNDDMMAWMRNRIDELEATLVRAKCADLR